MEVYVKHMMVLKGTKWSGNEPNGLDWWDCRVDLDVVLTLHVTDAVEAVGVQCLEVPGTVDGH